MTERKQQKNKEDREYENRRYELAHESDMKSEYPLAHPEGIVIYLIFGLGISFFLWLMISFID
tara:strand:- start:154 stop:342 length:189 start_codon:yes stop_codon:yes gene_type:complete